MRNVHRRTHSLLGLIVLVFVCFACAASGSLLTQTSIDVWYDELRKPAWTPPNWVFGPVWSALYLSMAVAAWLVGRGAGINRARVALALFALQLALNVGWSAVFFALRSPGAAFVELVLLVVAIAATIAAFWPRSRLAAVLMLPYLIWVLFAGALNYAIWRLNA